jgi:hypothetical protein
MRFDKLPSTLNKKDDKGNPVPNTINITNNVRLKSEAKEGEDVVPVKFEIPAERFEFKQFDSYDEFVADAGSPERALAIINEETMKAATASGKASIRTATMGTEEEMIEAGLRVSRSFTWKEETTLSTKDKANKFDELTALIGKVDPEELLKRLQELQAK